MSSTLRLSNLPSCAHLVVLAWMLANAAPLIAQETNAAPEPQPGAPAQNSPGLLNEIGKLLKSPADLLPSLSKPDTTPAQEPPAQTPPPVQAAPVQPAPSQPAPSKRPPTMAVPQVPAPTPAPAQAPIAETAPPSPTPAPSSSRMFPGMANGREACPASSGGGPDCQAATDKLCQSKGYKSGRSISTDSAYSCSARMARAEGGKACGTEYYVTSAFCQ